VTATAPAGPRLDAIALRNWNGPEDSGELACIRTMLTDREVRRWNPVAQLPDPTLPGAATTAAGSWLAKAAADERAWAVTDPADGRLLGGITLRDAGPLARAAAVGYWLLPDARGRGAAKLALRRVTELAFGRLAFNRVELGHMTGHAASCALALSCGYPIEGTARQALPDASGALHDLHLHARLASDD
jgi:RimJ/RimL family protein N-acetyltransferase